MDKALVKLAADLQAIRRENKESGPIDISKIRIPPYEPSEDLKKYHADVVELQKRSASVYFGEIR